MWLIKPKAALYNAAAYIAGAVVVGSFLALIAAWVIFQWQGVQKPACPCSTAFSTFYEQRIVACKIGAREPELEEGCFR